MKAIPVTKEHIAKGVRRDLCKCPVALAINDATIWAPMVFGLFVRLGDTDVDLPLEAQRWIDSFDNERPVAPFEFELKA